MEKWNFKGNEVLNASSSNSVRGAYNMPMESINNHNDGKVHDNKPVIRLCRVVPTDNPSFRTTPVAPDAVTSAVHSFSFNRYAPTAGLPQTKRLQERMENGTEKWNFKGNKGLNDSSSSSVRGVYSKLIENINVDKKPVIRLCRVDPTDNPSFRTAPVATDAVTSALHSLSFNHYAPTCGLPQTKRAIANYVSCDLPYELSADNVFVTAGGTQAIDTTLAVLASPGANILLPRPGYPHYESRAKSCGLQVRYFDLLPERGWEVDLDSLESLVDDNTVAMVIINPSNPCGNVFTYQHLETVAKTARKLGIFVISDEVYGHLAFGSNPFVPMGVFSSIVPVITIGSLSKRWLVPGWRIGWIATCDPHEVFQNTGMVSNILSYSVTAMNPPTFIQAAVPEILERTNDDFHSKNLNMMREAANLFCDVCEEISCFTCPHKPEGGMTAMVKINFSLIDAIIDDVDFCVKLAKEESVILLPGVTVGLKNWVRISLAVDISDLQEGLYRIKAFCLRHGKMKMQ